MNLIRRPSNSDTEGLREEYPQIGAQFGEDRTAARSNSVARPEEKRRKPAKAKAAPTPLTFPSAKSPKADPISSPGFSSKRRRSTPSDEEDDDDDGGLLVEYPGAEPPSSARGRADFSPAFSPMPRRYSEFQRTNEDDIMRYEEDEEDRDALAEVDMDADADAESEDAPGDDEDDRLAAFTLPSPVGGRNGTTQQALPPEDDGVDADMGDIEADFEAEMENAFQQVKGGAGEESDVSEED
jgi:hypothetical protein